MVFVISEIVGSVLGSTILMALVLYVLRKPELTNRPVRLVVSVIITLIGVTIVAGYGFADGGPSTGILIGVL